MTQAAGRPGKRAGRPGTRAGRPVYVWPLPRVSTGMEAVDECRVVGGGDLLLITGLGHVGVDEALAQQEEEEHGKADNHEGGGTG